MKTDDLIAGLPGEDLVRRGLADFAAGRCTIASCLVAMASPRLRRADLIRGDPPFWQADAEHRVYQMLLQGGGDAFSRYNALLRELGSFENALDRRRRMD